MFSIDSSCCSVGGSWSLQREPTRTSSAKSIQNCNNTNSPISVELINKYKNCCLLFPCFVSIDSSCQIASHIPNNCNYSQISEQALRDFLLAKYRAAAEIRQNDIISSPAASSVQTHNLVSVCRTVGKRGACHE